MNALPATRRRLGIGLVALCVALLSSACATGRHAPTANETPAIDGAGATAGSLRLEAVAIKAPEGGSYPAGSAAAMTLVIVNSGTSDDTLVGISSPAASGVHLFANSSDAAAVASPTASGSTSASTSGSASGSGSGSASASASGSTSGSATSSASSSASATASGSSSGAAPAQLTSLPVPGSKAVQIGLTDSSPALQLSGLSKPLYPGTTIEVTFRFAKAGSVTVRVPVQLSDLGSGSGIVISPSETSAG